MPTGYTAAIQDGISFEKFTLRCARNFGALIELRDEPLNAPIPQAFKPSPYYANALSEAKTKMTRLEEMSAHEADAAAQRAFEVAERERHSAIAKKQQERERYEAMLVKVRAWVPPTSDHVGLKKFMEDQITESIRFDCEGDYYNKPTVRLSGAAWRAREIVSTAKSIARLQEENAKESERVNERNEWIAALRASLATPPAFVERRNGERRAGKEHRYFGTYRWGFIFRSDDGKRTVDGDESRRGLIDRRAPK